LRVGLIGYPLGHSISPVFQQAAFDALELPARYSLWETPAERLAVLVNGLRAEDVLGANVTIPYKQSVLPLLDVIDPTAVAIGAVNTFVRRGAALYGHNTDAIGFIRSLRRDGQLELRGRRIVVLGAGGAARAVVAGLVAEGSASVCVAARRIEQAEALVSSLGSGASTTNLFATVLSSAAPSFRDVVSRADILVNTTPVGMAHRPDEAALPLEADLLTSRLFVCDLVYNPPETPLLRAALARGARTLNGLPMLVEQGAAAFELWTGRTAPVELMRAKALEALRG
jgi:shikimate dehydrogenase